MAIETAIANAADVLAYTKLVHVWHYLISSRSGDDRDAAFAAAKIVEDVKKPLLYNLAITGQVIVLAHDDAMWRY